MGRSRCLRAIFSKTWRDLVMIISRGYLEEGYIAAVEKGKQSHEVTTFAASAK